MAAWNGKIYIGTLDGRLVGAGSWANFPNLTRTPLHAQEAFDSVVLKGCWGKGDGIVCECVEGGGYEALRASLVKRASDLKNASPAGSLPAL